MSPARKLRKVCLVDLLSSEILDVSVGAYRKVTLSLVCEEMGDRVGGDPGL